MLVLVLLVATASVAYFFLKGRYQYWENKGVKGPKPIPLLGNLGRTFFFQAMPGIVYSDIYNDFKNEEIVGAYRGITPVLVLNDPEIIKEATTKHFSNFHDNDIYIDKNVDPIFGRNPFSLKGEEWKTTRALSTPAFSSGKMKWLYPFLEENAEKLITFMESKAEMSNGEGYEAKELSIRFTLNNVASCGFGIEGKCFEEENNEFRQLSKDMFSPDAWTIVGLTLATNYPKISNYMRLRVVSKKVETKLAKMVSETLKYRDENNIVRNDFLHILNDIKKSSKGYNFTDLDVTAHAAGFFIDGSESSAISMSFALFELAANPEAQERLRQELDKAWEENKGQFPYEVLQTLPYLDAAINEALRIHPISFSLQKVCTEAFTFTSRNGQPVKIEKDTPIIIPIYGLHHDPQYFEDPESYKPERFLEENKDRLTNYTFMPFGEGPRACLGRRFALLQVKVGIAHIIRNFRLSVNKRTKLPIKYHSFISLTTPLGGLWIDYQKIL